MGPPDNVRTFRRRMINFSCPSQYFWRCEANLALTCNLARHSTKGVSLFFRREDHSSRINGRSDRKSRHGLAMLFILHRAKRFSDSPTIVSIMI